MELTIRVQNLNEADMFHFLLMPLEKAAMRLLSYG